jgi:hypothetical protein
MAFCVTPKPTFKTKAYLTIPGSDTPGEIELEFKYLNPEQLSQFRKDHGDKPIVESLSKLMIGWSGPVDEAGNPVPYSVEALTQLDKQFHTVGDELWQAYLLEVHGARRKN